MLHKFKCVVCFKEIEIKILKECSLLKGCLENVKNEITKKTCGAFDFAKRIQDDSEEDIYRKNMLLHTSYMMF